MSIAEKFEIIADEVYEIGYEKGKAEGGNTEEAYNQGFVEGKQAEYDKFWDAFQQNGERAYYYYAFAYQWNDECYNPKYPIVCGTSNTDGNNIFRGSEITDTKVPIYLSGNGQAMFYSCKQLKTIRKLVVTEDASYVNMFYTTATVENITIEGVIGKSLSMAACPLTIESMKSIINALKDHSGTDKEGTYELRFSSGCWEVLEADSTAPDGSTWQEYVENLGWLI